MMLTPTQRFIRDIQLVLFPTIILAMIVSAGCSGAADGAGMVPYNPAPLNTDNPVFVEPLVDPTPVPTPTPIQKPAPTPKIVCPKQSLPDGEVGAEYSFQLEGSGGSGNLTYETKDTKPLPGGLSVDSDGLVSGTPTIAEKANNAVVIVTDEDGQTKSCTVKIAIEGELAIKAAAISGKEGDWDAVYEVTIEGKWKETPTWAWAGDITNACFSSEKPDTSTDAFRTGCTVGSAVSSGQKAYLWLKNDKANAVVVEIALTINSDVASEKAKHSFSFAYSSSVSSRTPQHDGTPSSSTTILPPLPLPSSSPSPVAALKVELLTGNAGDDSDTDCQVSIKFCEDKEMSRCTSKPIVLDDIADDDDRENGEKNTYTSRRYADAYDPGDFDLPKTGEGTDMTDKYQYFQLKLEDPCGDDDNEWLLQGIRVEAKYADAAKAPYIYYNPCVEKWMDKGDILNFGPNDTAVCAIVKTIDKTTDNNFGGTNSPVSLVMENFAIAELPQRGGFESVADWAPEFEIHDDNKLALAMRWNGADDIDDFAQGSENSYGDYIFDVKPAFKDTPSVILHLGGGDSWIPARAQVFVFQPGKFMNANPTGEPILYYTDQTLSHVDSYAASDSFGSSDPVTMTSMSSDAQVLDSDEGNRIVDTRPIILQPASADLVDDSIGGHF